jgi:hypothetical protein
MTTGLHPDSLRNAQKLQGHYPKQLSLPSKLKIQIGFFVALVGAATAGIVASNMPGDGKFVVNAGNVAMLAHTCANSEIKPTLKDPNSFRELRHGYNKRGVSLIDVTVEYTATNGFGGRVRNNHTCTYTL